MDHCPSPGYGMAGLQVAPLVWRHSLFRPAYCAPTHLNRGIGIGGARGASKHDFGILGPPCRDFFKRRSSARPLADRPSTIGLSIPRAFRRFQRCFAAHVRLLALRCPARGGVPPVWPLLVRQGGLARLFFRLQRRGWRRNTATLERAPSTQRQRDGKRHSYFVHETLWMPLWNGGQGQARRTPSQLMDGRGHRRRVSHRPLTGTGLIQRFPSHMPTLVRKAQFGAHGDQRTDSADRRDIARWPNLRMITLSAFAFQLFCAPPSGRGDIGQRAGKGAPRCAARDQP